MLSYTLSALGRDERGATAIEYALIASLISIAAIAGFTAVGDELINLFGYVSDEAVGTINAGAASATTP